MISSMNKFKVIVADPPYSFKDKLQQSDVARGASDNYSVMTISDIKQLPINDIADPTGAVLALWVPSSLLQEGLDTMKAWGFAHKQTYVWVKTINDPWKNIDLWVKKHWLAQWENNPFTSIKDIKLVSELCSMVLQLKIPLISLLSFGMGRLFRQTHEICLIGTNNNKIYKSLQNKSQRSVSFAPNLKHSAKPEHLQDALELMFPEGNKLELFARRQRSHWICLGNEIDGLDIRDALSQLK
jgi:N6-adenosine-specific RNA methylase IME4